MKYSLPARQALAIAVIALFLAVLACTEAQKAPVQTAGAQAAQTAMAAGAQAVETEAVKAAQTALAAGAQAAQTEAVQLMATGQVAGSTAAVNALGTLAAQVSTQAVNSINTLVSGIPTFQLPVSGSGVSIAGYLPGQGDHTNADTYAVDFIGPAGTPIRPALDGEVVYSGDCGCSYGYAVALRHQDIAWDHIYYSIYANLDGQGLPGLYSVVDVSSVIGYMGSSGTDRVQLHFAVRESDKFYDGEQALYGQVQNSDGTVTILTPAFNVRQVFGLNP